MKSFYNFTPLASVAELVDALDSKSSFGNKVWVRFPPEVLISKKIDQYFIDS